MSTLNYKNSATIEPHHEVTAQITQWREGKTGRWASATILSEGAPTQTATCSATVKHHTPPTGQPFRAIIKKKANGNGYAIIDILIEGLEAELFAIPAVVRRKQGFDLLLDATPAPNGQSVSVTLPKTILDALQIGHIEVGTEVNIDAVRNASGYVVSKLHSPGVLDAFASKATPQTVIACVKSAWPGESNNKKGCFVTYRAPDAAVTASLWVGAKLLKGAYLPATLAWGKASECDPARRDEVIDQWQDILGIGTPADLETLKIDMLELQLEWLAADQKWQVCRLCRPRALREPQDSEIIDWVEGTVESIVEDKPPASATQPLDTVADHQPAQAPEAVDISFQDPRVGRGTLRFFGKEKITHAALGPGTQVIFSLKAKGTEWKIKCLHRATPVRPETTP